MKNLVIKFSYEWDKLKKSNRKPYVAFTTIRGYAPAKEVYYKNAVGETFDVMLMNKKIGRAVLKYTSIDRPSWLGLTFMQKDMKIATDWEDVRKIFYGFYKNEDPVCLVLYFDWSPEVE